MARDKAHTPEQVVPFLELDADATLRQAEHELAEIVQVAAEPVHRVADNRVSLSNERKHGSELRPFRVLAGDMIGKAPVVVHPSSCRSSLWSSVLTRMYPTDCPLACVAAFFVTVGSLSLGTVCIIREKHTRTIQILQEPVTYYLGIPYRYRQTQTPRRAIGQLSGFVSRKCS